MGEQAHLPADVVRVFQNMTTLFGPSFTITDIIRYIEALRQKDIRIEHAGMPTDISGYCVSLRDVDLICIRHGLDPQRVLFALLHELSHLLLGHIARHHGDERVYSYAEFIDHREDTSVRPVGVLRSIYDNAHEVAAETLATLLMTGISRQEQETPRLARLIYGDTR